MTLTRKSQAHHAGDKSSRARANHIAAALGNRNRWVTETDLTHFDGCEALRLQHPLQQHEHLPWRNRGLKEGNYYTHNI